MSLFCESPLLGVIKTHYMYIIIFTSQPWPGDISKEYEFKVLRLFIGTDIYCKQYRTECVFLEY